MGSIRAVLFDLHDTLVHLVPSTEEAMATAIDVPVDDYRLAWHTIDERIENGTWAPATAQRWTDLYAPMVAARFGTLFRTADAYAAFPDVAPAIRALADAGFRLGVLSNSDFPLEPFLARCGIDGFIDAAVSCREPRHDETTPGGVPPLHRCPWRAT